MAEIVGRETLELGLRTVDWWKRMGLLNSPNQTPAPLHFRSSMTTPLNHLRKQKFDTGQEFSTLLLIVKSGISFQRGVAQ
jgi:hypothetical protein